LIRSQSTESIVVTLQHKLQNDFALMDKTLQALLFFPAIC